MSGSTLIGLMTAGFGLITLVAIVAVLLRFRRRPIVWLLARNAKQMTFHSDAVAALASAMTAAREAGRRDEYAAMAASYRLHRRHLLELDAAAATPDAPAFAPV